MKKIKLLCLAFPLIFFTACSRQFPVKPFTSEESERVKFYSEINNHDSQVALGRLYFFHNLLNEANAELEKAIGNDPADMEAKAWYEANLCKIAGKKGPWLMGLDKLYLVWSCLSELDNAVSKAPDDFAVQLIQINTDIEVDMFGSFSRGTERFQRLQQQINQNPDHYSASAKADFYDTSAKLALIQHNQNQAKSYWLKIIELNANADSVQNAKSSLAALPKE